MDFVDAANILMSRIQNLEPEMGNKVIGVILIDYPERDVIRLACAPEMVIENLVKKTKLQLGLWPRPPVSTLLTTPISINSTPVSDVPLNSMPFSPNGSRLYSCQNAVGVPQVPYWNPQQPLAPEPQSVLSSNYASYGDFNSEDLCLQNQAHFTAFDDQMDPKNSFPGEPYYADAALSNLRSRRSSSLSDLPLKTCHYFSKGFCRHGSNCRYIHGSDYSSPSLFSPNELGADDHIISPAALDKLDLEISELLKSRRGNPVSIASLPMLYHEMYRKTLQADGYLTERRRQGRAGYSLTKLLGQLKRIRLIERAHGQHDVILAEDAPKFNLDNRSERNDPGQIVSGSRQIYLTFPPESTFSEEDVSDYFSNFGPVEDVRIPCQQKRMFGFVTFASADAVKSALAKGNPHFVCGSRVLVKPYREKSKPVDRKNMEKNDHGMYYPGYYSEIEHDFHPKLRFEAPRFKRQFIKDQEQDLEMKRRYLSQLQIGRKNIINDHMISNGNGNGMEDLYASDVHSYNPSMEQYYMMDAFRNCTISDDRSRHLSTDDADNDSQGINLPESPFSSTMGNSNREEKYF